MNKVYTIILASGNGERAGYHIPKQFMKIAGKTIIEHTIHVFERNACVDEIIVVVNPQYRALMEQIMLKNDYKKVKRILNGGPSRKESSAIGLHAIDDDDAVVLIHDAVRPFVSDRIINDCVNALHYYNAVDVAIPSADTIINVNDDNCINQIPTRKYMWRGQTPQGFKVGLIKEAHKLSKNDEILEVTDDCGLILKYKLSEVYIVPGEERNMKITFPEDVFLADKIFQSKTTDVPEHVDLSGLYNKVVVIFGSSRGIGKSLKSIAQSLGAKVYGFSRSENGTDVSDIGNVKAALGLVHQKESRINFVINTAGILRLGKVQSRNINDIHEEMNINYVGAINTVKESIRYLAETKGGILLFTSSSYTRGRALYCVYSSTKAAVVNLIQGVSEELLEDGIKINAINPERTNTPMRTENFGKEPPESLLNPDTVAICALRTILSDLSGQVIDVRKEKTER